MGEGILMGEKWNYEIGVEYGGRNVLLRRRGWYYEPEEGIFGHDKEVDSIESRSIS